MRRFPAFAIVLAVTLAAVMAAGAWLLLRVREPTGLAADDAIDVATRGDASPEATTALAPRPARGDESLALPRIEVGGTIVGTVRRGGKPVAAHVEVLGSRTGDRAGWDASPDRMLATTARLARKRAPEGVAAAGEDGRFEIVGIAPGQVHLVATTHDGARGVSTVVIEADGWHAIANVDLAEPAPPLRGHAIYADGRPFSGFVAMIPERIFRPPSEDGAVHTDEDGHFVVTGLAAGPHLAWFVVPGAISFAVSASSGPSRVEWEVVVDRSVSSIEGRVVDDATGAPIEGAVIASVSRIGWLSASRLARTDADGRFTAPRLLAAMPSLAISADGYATLGLDSASPPPLVVRLRRPSSIIGVTRRAADLTPIPGASVRVVLAGAYRSESLLAQTRSGPDGRYEVVGLPPVDVAVFASAPGLTTALSLEPVRRGEVETGACLAPGERATIDLALIASGAIAGRVLDEVGAPVPSAAVRLWAFEEDGRPGAIDPAFENRTWTAAADGQFVVDGLDPSMRVRLGVGTADRGWTSSELVRPEEREPARVEIRLRRPQPPRAPRPIVVTVVDGRGGAPIANASVSTGGAPAAVPTDAAGRVTVVGIDSASLTVTASARGFATIRRTAGEKEAAVELRLPVGRTISGRVERADGKSVAGVYVKAAPKGTDGLESVARCAADGTFAMEGCDDVEVAVSVEGRLDGGAWLRGSATARPGSPVTVRVAPTGGEVRVRAIDRDGRWVESARIRAWGASVPWERMYGGEIVVGRQKKEGFVVEVSDARDAYGRPLGAAPARATVGPDETEVVVPVVPGATIEGVVHGPDGPVGRVVVLAVRLNDVERARSDQRTRPPLASTRSEADGRFRVVGLAPDVDLALVVLAPTGLAPRPPIPVRSGATGVEIALRVGIRPQIRVVGSSGEPIAGVTVRVEAENGSLLGVDPDRSGCSSVIESGSLVRPAADPRTDRAGVARVMSLDPAGIYRLVVNARDRQDLSPAVIDPWTPTDEVIALPPAFALEGVVMDATGKPLNGPTIRMPALRMTDRTVSSSGDSGGRFRFARAAVGTTTLHVESPQFLSRDVTIDIRSSMVPVTITLDKGRGWRLRIAGWDPQLGARLSALDGERPPPPYEFGPGVDSDGRVLLETVDPLRPYTLWSPAPPASDDYVLLRGARWSDGETVLSRTRGGTIRGHVVLPPGASRVQLTARSGPVVLDTTIAGDGSFAFRGVPPGRFTVEVSAEAEYEPRRTSVEAEVGDNVTLRLSDPYDSPWENAAIPATPARR